LVDRRKGRWVLAQLDEPFTTRHQLVTGQDTQNASKTTRRSPDFTSMPRLTRSVWRKDQRNSKSPVTLAKHPELLGLARDFNLLPQSHFFAFCNPPLGKGKQDPIRLGR